MCKKPMFIDTNIFKNITGFDNEDSDIARLYKKERLLNYVKHHGCKITVFTLYEVLRYKELSNESIAKIQKLNFSTYTPYDQEEDVYTNNIKNELNDVFKREMFLSNISKRIIEYASEYYSTLLLFPIFFTCYAFNQDVENNRLGLSSFNFKSIVDEINREVKSKLYKAMLKESKFFNKSTNKSINSAYKWINQICVDWYNDEVKNYYENKSKESFIKVFDGINERVHKVNFLDELIIQPNNQKHADERTNFIYLLFNKLKMLSQNDMTVEKWKEVYVKRCNDIFNIIYTKSGNKVIDAYYEKTLSELFLRNVNNIDTNNTNNLRKILDVNDIIDLISLNFVYMNKGILLSTDSDILILEKNIYGKKEKQVINDFIELRQFNKIDGEHYVK